MESFLVDVDKPNFWVEGSDIRVWVDRQRKKGATGIRKCYDSELTSIRAEGTISLEKSAIVKKHEDDLAVSRRRHAVANIRPAIRWSRQGTHAWRGVQPARREKGAKVWDEKFYLHWPKVLRSDETYPYVLTLEDRKGVVYEIGMCPTIGEAMKLANRTSVCRAIKDEMPV